MTDRRLLSPMSVLLLDAADYIETHGHYKGAYFNRSPDYEGSIFPPACLVGSFLAVTRITVEDYQVKHTMVNKAEKYMNDYLNDNCTAWNDDMDRTAGEVIKALREAAIAYKEYANADEA
jgi:hypothetical protein